MKQQGQRISDEEPIADWRLIADGEKQLSGSSIRSAIGQTVGQLRLGSESARHEWSAEKEER